MSGEPQLTLKQCDSDTSQSPDRLRGQMAATGETRAKNAQQPKPQARRQGGRWVRASKEPRWQKSIEAGIFWRVSHLLCLPHDLGPHSVVGCNRRRKGQERPTTQAPGPATGGPLGEGETRGARCVLCASIGICPFVLICRKFTRESI